MPDKHEVGGSSPLGPTSEVKDLAKTKYGTGRPRAFIERELTKVGVDTRCKGRTGRQEPQGTREI